MKHLEIVQYHADHVALIAGTDVDFGMPVGVACEECGSMVDLSTEINVPFVVGLEREHMTEANARQLLLEVGIVPPPVMCSRHEGTEVFHG